MFDYLNDAYAYGEPSSSGTIKATPEDFRVYERLGFELTGEGEHQFLYIEKTGLNTEELQKAVARQLGKPEKMVAYAGLKDRQAVTRQWLSVHCPGEHIDGVDSLQGDGWRVLENRRHNKKLKTGALAGNAFTVVIRDMNEPAEVESRLTAIKKSGVPNYFGPQRFGNNGQNLEKAFRLLTTDYKVKNPFLRGLYYSAARSFLFNRLLSERVEHKLWNQAIAGDVMQLAGTHSVFALDEVDAQIEERVRSFDISPTAPLWGKGRERASLESLALQEKVFGQYQSWRDGLERHKLERACRPLVLPVKDLVWDWQGDEVVTLCFELPPGSYATSVVRELVGLHGSL
ncbi:tRNA pseudouridine(13) synthase TruD [Legionella spiritensis]|uniref:tRNA pseudouridine synthase D n=1 Tax=Legionella spiritensis TaxID=452 RepID=A0A0W0ZAM8_LEGSP|nr:tRNA pseudouridine(13) synthase TruD [Legionella spiritensis]KTD66194.1 hydrogenase [Legionella spiritensis]SNV35168.1 hydrogenase [Legionella spiritensis]